jgi:hypothetical protein
MNDLGSEAAALKQWLSDVALPQWWEDGADHMRGIRSISARSSMFCARIAERARTQQSAQRQRQDRTH